jgi:hypothetical protein
VSALDKRLDAVAAAADTPPFAAAFRRAAERIRRFHEAVKPRSIAVEDPESYGLPRRGLGVRCLFATEDRFFVYPTKLREYQARYRGAFLHGGVSPEEMILPVALLQPRAAS